MIELENKSFERGDSKFEAKLFQAADKLRGSMDASEYKYVVLGLIFLKYISDTFSIVYQQLKEDKCADEENPREYLANYIFWIPKESRWCYLQARSKQPEIGKCIDDAMFAIEKTNSNLKGVLPTNYECQVLNYQILGELIELISTIGINQDNYFCKDVFGYVYEYFLDGFASMQGKRGGEFYTPRSVVRLLIEILRPYKGRVYDPCCGSGGMFVQSENFVLARCSHTGDVAIYGQEMNNTTWRLAKMNMALHGINADIRWNSQGSFHQDEFPNLRADYILANPPFNVSDWGGQHLQQDIRWKYGVPPKGNANYAWLQHIIHHLAPDGTAGVVLANGSMSSRSNSEYEIRKCIIEDDLVDCIIALPPALFYSTKIPACLWFLAKQKNRKGCRDRRGETLFIDAHKLGSMVDRNRREFTNTDITSIVKIYDAWCGSQDTIGLCDTYKNIPGLCFSAKLDDIRAHDYMLTPSRFVGIQDQIDDGLAFVERFAALKVQLEDQFAKGAQLQQQIILQLAELFKAGQ